MLKRTRISRHMDTNRLGAAMARPGMDTRVWVSLAIALGESHVDPQHGVFIDVALMPTGEEYTARVGADYAGQGFGIYAKIHADDELMVCAPSGDPAEGIVVTRRMWSASDLPPQEAIDNPDDLVLAIEADKTVRMRVTGQGQVVLNCEATVTVNCPDVRLGDVNPPNFAARDDKVLTELSNIVTNITSNYALLVTAIGSLGGAYTPVNPSAPSSVASETTKVK